MPEPITGNQRRLNPARPWTVVWLGRYHEHAIAATILIALMPIGVIVAAGGRRHSVLLTGLAVLGLFLMSGVARHFILAPLTGWLKRVAVGPFRVVYFRSFREDQSHTARDLIAPILGCIGRLTTINNAAYIQGLTGSEGHDQDEDSLLAWLELGEVLSDGLTAIDCEGDAWRKEVKRQLADVDLAVIDLTVDSDNVAWEKRQALSFLPDDRVIIICAAGADAADVDGIAYELSPKGRHRFRKALRSRLAKITSRYGKVPGPNPSVSNRSGSESG